MGTTNELADSDVELNSELSRFTNEIIIIQNTEAENPGLRFQTVTSDETKSVCNAMPINLEHEQERRKECNTQQLVATSLINDTLNGHERAARLTSSAQRLEKEGMERSFAIIAKDCGELSRNSTDKNEYSLPFVPESDIKEFGQKLRDLDADYGYSDVHNDSCEFESDVLGDNSPHVERLYSEQDHDISFSGYPVVFGSKQDIVDLYQGTIPTSKIRKSCSSFGSQIEIDKQGVIQISCRQNSLVSSHIPESNPDVIFPFFTEDSEDENVFGDVEFSKENPFQGVDVNAFELSECKNSTESSAHFEQMRAKDNIVAKEQRSVQVTDLDDLVVNQEIHLTENEPGYEKEHTTKEKLPDEIEKEMKASDKCGDFLDKEITPKKTKRTSNLSRLSVNLDGNFHFEVEDIIIPQECTPRILNITSLFMEDCAGEDEIIPVILTKKTDLFRDCVHEQVIFDRVEHVSCTDTKDVWNFLASSDDQTDSVPQNISRSDDSNDSYGFDKKLPGKDSAAHSCGEAENADNSQDVEFSVRSQEDIKRVNVDQDNGKDHTITKLYRVENTSCESVVDVFDADQEGATGGCLDDNYYVGIPGDNVPQAVNVLSDANVASGVIDNSGSIQAVSDSCNDGIKDGSRGMKGYHGEDERNDSGHIEDDGLFAFAEEICFLVENGDGTKNYDDGHDDVENYYNDNAATANEYCDRHCGSVEDVQIAEHASGDHGLVASQVDHSYHPVDSITATEEGHTSYCSNTDNTTVGDDKVLDSASIDKEEDDDFVFLVSIDADEDSDTKHREASADAVWHSEGEKSAYSEEGNKNGCDTIIKTHPHGEIDNSANEINSKSSCSTGDEDVKSFTDITNSAHWSCAGEINDNYSNVCLNNDVTLLKEIEDSHGIIEDLNTTDTTNDIINTNTAITKEISVGTVVNSNQGVSSDVVISHGKQVDESLSLKTNDQPGQPFENNAHVSLLEEDLQQEKVSNDLKTPGKQKSSKRKESRKSKGTKSTKKSKKAGHSKNSKDEQKPKPKEKKLRSDLADSTNSEDGISLDKEKSTSKEPDAAKSTLTLDTNTSGLSLDERIENVNRSIDWVRKVLMEMRAQDLNLKMQFDGLRQEVRTLKEEYDEYVNCEYYDEEELRNIEYLNYKTKDKNLNSKPLQEDSGYHSESVEQDKGTNCAKAKYIYQPTPSFPKVQTLKSSNCVFEFVL